MQGCVMYKKHKLYILHAQIHNVTTALTYNIEQSFHGFVVI